MGDSTNAEEQGYAPSERSVGGVLRSLFAQHRGRRIITASFASHLHRIQQIADAAVEAKPQDRHARAEHQEERAARPRSRPAATSPTRR